MSETDIILAAIGELRADIRHLGERVSGIAEHGCSKAAQHADLEGRVRVAEDYIARQRGMTATIATTGSVVSALVVSVGMWLFRAFTSGGHQ
jgi:hypothetical protein